MPQLSSVRHDMYELSGALQRFSEAYSEGWVVSLVPKVNIHIEYGPSDYMSITGLQGELPRKLTFDRGSVEASGSSGTASTDANDVHGHARRWELHDPTHAPDLGLLLFKIFDPRVFLD